MERGARSVISVLVKFLVYCARVVELDRFTTHNANSGRFNHYLFFIFVASHSDEGYRR